MAGKKTAVNPVVELHWYVRQSADCAHVGLADLVGVCALLGELLTEAGANIDSNHQIAAVF
ncbi:hypothetical protein E8K88_17930 [Lampropedia aestuarii]|uniref:Uncharacterized protein n=1 Tax=Lampropedia aestuarii TaxID=2562762 RepID=A0A4S5BC52_9BURK|nr:hypothetical protein [Lampropedia aestuarii]MDH5856735.1 hypothetical protein [Lampropedia aestuarii]THJ29650.1 hypothetical protein E8K88_17930 [Lampropedia aestuarii]